MFLDRTSLSYKRKRGAETYIEVINVTRTYDNHLGALYTYHHMTKTPIWQEIIL